MAAMLANLKAGVPRSPLPRRDPYALRSALALGLVAAFVLNASQWRNRIADAVALEPRQAVAARAASTPGSCRRPIPAGRRCC
jgi:hypothetical protein